MIVSRTVENTVEPCPKEKSMAHTIQYCPTAHIIQVNVEGIVKLDEFKEIFCQGVQLAKKKGCFLFLNDFCEATLQMSTMELYALPKILSEISTSCGIPAERIWRAIVIAPRDARDAGFAEDVAANRGQHARIFQDREEAREWLVGDHHDESLRRPYAKPHVSTMNTDRYQKNLR
jgi:hypothetical protein